MGRKFFDFKGIIVCITLLINFTSISVSQINIDPTKFELSNASSSKIAPSYNSSENYFILTTKNKRQTGAIWYNKNKNIIDKINLANNNFITFKAYFGDAAKLPITRKGADGIIFILHNTIFDYSAYDMSSGGCLNYALLGTPLKPNPDNQGKLIYSLGIEFDTYSENPNISPHDNISYFGDFDVQNHNKSVSHIAFDANGYLLKKVSNIAVIPILHKNENEGLNNQYVTCFNNGIDDNKWHDIKISWNNVYDQLNISNSYVLLQVYFEGILMSSLKLYDIDLFKYFNFHYNNTYMQVDWGITAATGDLDNEQRVAFNDFVNTPEDQTICYGDKLQLITNHFLFDPVNKTVSFHWEPSDGTLDDQSLESPTATPQTTTTYKVEMTIKDLSGNILNTLKNEVTISVNGKPDHNIATGFSRYYVQPPTNMIYTTETINGMIKAKGGDCGYLLLCQTNSPDLNSSIYNINFDLAALLVKIDCSADKIEWKRRYYLDYGINWQRFENKTYFSCTGWGCNYNQFNYSTDLINNQILNKNQTGYIITGILTDPFYYNPLYDGRHGFYIMAIDNQGIINGDNSFQTQFSQYASGNSVLFYDLDRNLTVNLEKDSYGKMLRQTIDSSLILTGFVGNNLLFTRLILDLKNSTTNNPPFVPVNFPPNKNLAYYVIHDNLNNSIILEVEPNDIIELHDGNYLITGKIKYPNQTNKILIIKISNQNGLFYIPLWAKLLSLSTSAYDEYEGVGLYQDPLPPNNIFLTANTTSNSGDHVSIIKFNENGNIINAYNLIPSLGYTFQTYSTIQPTGTDYLGFSFDLKMNISPNTKYTGYLKFDKNNNLVYKKPIIDVGNNKLVYTKNIENFLLSEYIIGIEGRYFDLNMPTRSDKDIILLSTYNSIYDCFNSDINFSINTFFEETNLTNINTFYDSFQSRLLKEEDVNLTKYQTCSTEPRKICFCDEDYIQISATQYRPTINYDPDKCYFNINILGTSKYKIDNSLCQWSYIRFSDDGINWSTNQSINLLNTTPFIHNRIINKSSPPKKIFIQFETVDGTICPREIVLRCSCSCDDLKNDVKLVFKPLDVNGKCCSEIYLQINSICEYTDNFIIKLNSDNQILNKITVGSEWSTTDVHNGNSWLTQLSISGLDLSVNNLVYLGVSCDLKSTDIKSATINSLEDGDCPINTNEFKCCCANISDVSIELTDSYNYGTTCCYKLHFKVGDVIDCKTTGLIITLPDGKTIAPDGRNFHISGNIGVVDFCIYDSENYGVNEDIVVKIEFFDKYFGNSLCIKEIPLHLCDKKCCDNFSIACFTWSENGVTVTQVRYYFGNINPYCAIYGFKMFSSSSTQFYSFLGTTPIDMNSFTIFAYNPPISGYIVFLNKNGEPICDPLIWDFTHCTQLNGPPIGKSNDIKELTGCKILENDFRIVPNPSDGIIKIEFMLKFKDKVTIELYDLTGNKVSDIFNDYSNILENSINYKTDKLPSGSYMIKLTSNGNIITKNFIIIH